MDVSRHFQPVSTVLKLLNVMGMYKLNQLHLHLSDDEAWRLEIPALPELTQVSANSLTVAVIYNILSSLAP